MQAESSPKHPTLILLPAEKLPHVNHVLRLFPHMDAMSWDDFNNKPEQYYKGRLSPYPVVILLPYYAKRYGKDLWNETAVAALAQFLRGTHCIFFFLLPTRAFMVTPHPEDAEDWPQIGTSILHRTAQNLLELILGVSISIHPSGLFDGEYRLSEDLSPIIQDHMTEYLNLQMDQLGMNFTQEAFAEPLVYFENWPDAPYWAARFRRNDGQAWLLPFDSNNLTADFLTLLNLIAEEVLRKP